MIDFNRKHNRRNTRSVKWDLGEQLFSSKDVLPMWVADMDFQAPTEVQSVLMDTVNHGIFGYTMIDDQLKQAIIQWLDQRHQWKIKSNWLSFSPSVITSLHIAINTFTNEWDSILIQPPVYPPFKQAIENLNRKVILNPLILENNQYKIDFTHLKDQFQKGVKAFILCSPHNPGGRVWTEKELLEIIRLCKQYDVLILSDEIHADIVHKGYTHLPIHKLANDYKDQIITFMSPTKTFNLAGLQVSYTIIQNDQKRNLFNQGLIKAGVKMLNTMGIIAMEAAYQHGEEWLNKLLDVLDENQTYLINELHTHTSLKVMKAEGTYLNWIDCRSLNLNTTKLQQFFIQEAKVGLNKGIDYGEEGNSFMRINIACPPGILREGVHRIISAYRLNYIKK